MTDKMTPEEAIEILKHEHDYAQLLSYVNEALDMAVEALEKQTPIKVKQTFKNDYDLVYCPRCGIRFFQYGLPFCGECGQALDWSERNGGERNVK